MNKSQSKRSDMDVGAPNMNKKNWIIASIFIGLFSSPYLKGEETAAEITKSAEILEEFNKYFKTPVNERTLLGEALFLEDDKEIIFIPGLIRRRDSYIVHSIEKKNEFAESWIKEIEKDILDEYKLKLAVPEKIKTEETEETEGCPGFPCFRVIAAQKWPKSVNAPPSDAFIQYFPDKEDYDKNKHNFIQNEEKSSKYIYYKFDPKITEIAKKNIKRIYHFPTINWHTGIANLDTFGINRIEELRVE